MINIAVLGYGVVGSGVVEIIKKNNEDICRNSESGITVKKILDIRDFDQDPNSHLFTKNPEDIFNDHSIRVVVETIGGIGAAYEFTKTALKSGKHVVTSNKELVATYGPELLELARYNNVRYLFEASVGGGIPIIRPLGRCLAANKVTQIIGILNGTTNYILTSMQKEGKNFDEALKEAQEKGYAELKPEADIEGHDACRKIAILSSIAYNEFIEYKDIYTEGISKITINDIRYAQSLGFAIKLIALSKRLDNNIFARVCPVFIRKTHLLANIEGVYNAIFVRGNAVGDVMFYGQGAGKLPTASAVVADIIDILKHIKHNIGDVWNKNSEKNIIPLSEAKTKYFIRFRTVDIDKAKDEIIKLFGVVTFLDKIKESEENEFAFLSQEDYEGVLGKAVERLSDCGCIQGIESVIRILDEEI